MEFSIESTSTLFDSSGKPYTSYSITTHYQGQRFQASPHSPQTQRLPWLPHIPLQPPHPSAANEISLRVRISCECARVCPRLLRVLCRVPDSSAARASCSP